MSKDRILLLGGLRGVLLHTLHSLDRGETQALMKVSNLPKATQPSVCNRSSDVLIPKLGLFPKYREALREDSEWMRKRLSPSTDSHILLNSWALNLLSGPGQ